jgi:hypothetical protein
MALTLLAIPFLFFGVFVRTSDEGPQRCIGVAKDKFCYERTSQMPEFIKYGSVAIGFGLLYAGRLQMRRRREGK